MKKIFINIDNTFSYDNTFLEKITLTKESEINISFISNFKSAKILRSFITDICNKLQLDSIWKSRFILIADELNNNAIEYGSLSGELNSFKTVIKPFLGDIILNFEVTDTGNGKTSKTAKEMILIRNRKKLNGFHKNNGIRGRGLFMIIEKLVDKLYFKDSKKGGLIVGIEKKLKIKKD